MADAGPKASTSAPSSQSQFRNIEPRTRDERMAERNKDALEKQRLRSRTGGFNSYTPPTNPVVPGQNSPLYMDERSRFGAPDAASLEHQRRQQEHKKKEDQLERKRAEKYYQEKSKWDGMEQQSRREEQRFQQLRETGIGGKKNKSGQDYNILTLDYAQTHGGQILKHQDDTTVFKSQMRAMNLYAKSNSVTHNIITGQPLQAPLAPPQRPVAPWDK